MLSHFSHVRLCDLMDYIVHQAPLPMVFFRHEYWSGLPFLSPGDLPNPGVKPLSPVSLTLAGEFFTTSATKILWGTVLFEKIFWEFTFLLPIPMWFSFILEIQAHFIHPTGTNEELMNRWDTGSNKWLQSARGVQTGPWWEIIRSEWKGWFY